MIQEFKLVVDRPRTHPLIFLVVSCCIHISAIFCWSLVVKSACLMFKIPSLDLKPPYLLIANTTTCDCSIRDAWNFAQMDISEDGNITQLPPFFPGKWSSNIRNQWFSEHCPLHLRNLMEFATKARWTQISNWFKMVYIRESKLHIFQMFRHVEPRFWFQIPWRILGSMLY